jgi:hypothetical protein
LITVEDIADAMLGPVVAGRQCGGCVTCCTALTIATKELTKPAGTPCRHNDGAGCTIYEARPPVCRNWHCGWRRLEMLPDDFRPDRSGILIAFQIALDAKSPLERCCIIVRLSDPRRVDQRHLSALLDMFRKARIPVWVAEGSRRELAHPGADIGRHLMAGTRPGGRLGEEVRQWEARLPLQQA